MIATRSVEGGSLASVAPLPRLPVAVDAKGRVRVSREQRAIILAELESSGLSLPEFARRAGLKYSTLAAWVARSRRVQRAPRPSAVRLVEAVLPGPAAAALWVHLPGGARMELREGGQIELAAALVRALEKPC